MPPKKKCRSTAAALLPARQRPDRQGSAAAPLRCIQSRFSVGPTAAGPPCPPPFPNPGGLPGRPVGGGVFSSPGAQTSPLLGCAGRPLIGSLFLARARDLSGAKRCVQRRKSRENRKEPQRIAENRLPAGRRTEKGRRAPKTGCSAALAHTGGSGCLLRAAAALCGDPRRKSAPTARPSGRDAALLPDGGSRYNGRGGYAQRLPRAALL